LLFDDHFVDFSQWSVEKCCAHSQTIQPAPIRESPTAAWFNLRRADPSPPGVLNASQRTELLRPRLTGWTRDHNGPFKAGDEVWYGFSIYIPADWINDAPYTPGGGEILHQLHEQPDGNNYARNRTSFLVLLAEAGNFRWVTRWDSCSAAEACWKRTGIERTPSVYVGPLRKGEWTDWVVHAKWSYGADGLLEIWRDGRKVGTQSGPNNYNTHQPGFFKLGLYKWSWENTGIPERAAVYDNLRIAGADANYWNVAPRPDSLP
jgi:hypothetical protein